MKTHSSPALFRSLFAAGLLASGLAVSSRAADSWTGTAGDGLWATSANWTSGVPNAQNADVAITTAGATVDLQSTSRTVGSLLIGNSTAVTLNSTGGGNLIFSSSIGNATLTQGAVNSNTTINAGITLTSSLDVKVGASTSTRRIDINGQVTGAGGINMVAASGTTGKLTLNNAANDFSGGVTIGNGANLAVNSGGAFLGSGNLTINNGAAIQTLVSGSLNVGGIQIWAGDFTTATSSGNLNMGTAAVDLNGGTRTVTLNTNLTRNTTVGGVISNGGLAVANIGTYKSSLILTGANTYAAGSTVNSGILATSTTGTFGTGDVTVADAAALTLGNAASIADSAQLTFGNSTINLNYTGTETLGSLFSSVSSTSMAAGIGYTATDLNNFFGGTIFTGTGLITVAGAIPEPSTYAAILGVLVLGGAACRRRGRGTRTQG